MINVLPVNDKIEVEAIFTDCGFEFNEKSGCVIADDKGEVLGRSLYYIDDSSITIALIEPTDDIMMADGILRCALHVADFRNITDAFYLESVPVDVLKTLDFIKNEADKSLKIEKLHQSSCNCEK